MIKWTKINQQRTRKTIIKELAVLALPLFLFFYGLKCVVTLHGREIVHIRTPGPFTVPVEGMAALATGLSYMGMSLFVILLFTDPLDERRWWVWRFLRGIFCWGSGAAAIWLTLKTRQLAGIDPASAKILMPNEIRPLFLAALPFVFMFGFLAAIVWAITMAGRKSIKEDLYEKALEPISIRARPFSYWGRGRGMAFQVIYLDKEGFTHHANCTVSGRKYDSVNWFKDEIQATDV